MTDLVERVARAILRGRCPGAMPFDMNRYPSAQRDAKAAIAILDGRHGWKLVPVEPTEEIERTSALKHKCHCGRGITQWAVNKWQDMLAAAPDPLGED